MNTTRAFVAALSAAAISLSAQADSVSITKVGEYDIDVEGCGGITYAGGNSYYILQDHLDPTTAGKSTVYQLTINAGSDGSVSSKAIGDPIVLDGNGDSEGIAYDPASGMVWVSDEATPTIKEFNPSTGAATGRAVAVPAIQRTQKVGNKSLEALTISGDGLTMWSCNEEALKCDGGIASNTVGTVVRLMKFTRPTVKDVFEHVGEWAYRTEPTATLSHFQCGLSGLCALPDGSLLALEREMSTGTFGRCQIYRLTPTAIAAATDVSDIASLNGATYTLVEKGSALVDFKSGDWNNMIVYEGICLGPRLSDGSQVVYLVSDGGTTKTIGIFTAVTVSRLCALRLSGLDIHTANFSAPAEGESSTVGSNYRFLKNATVNVALSGVECETAYPTNNAPNKSATWTATGCSPASGTGVGATFQIGDSDVEFAWTVTGQDNRAATPINGADTFEEYDVGAMVSAGEVAGWTGSGTVVAQTYTPPDPPGYTLAKDPHTKVVSIDGTVTRTYADTTNGNDRIDLMASVVARADEDDSPLDFATNGTQLAIMCGTDRKMRLYCRPAGADDPEWVTLSDTTYEDGQWIRVEVDMDYTTDPSEYYAHVRIDGRNLPTDGGVRSPANPTPGGPWYRVATRPSQPHVTVIGVSGSGCVDDVLKATPEFARERSAGTVDVDGVPIAWLEEQGRGLEPFVALDAADTPRLAAEGYTLGDAYDAGIDIDEDEPLRVADIAFAADGKLTLAFNGTRENPGKYSVLRADTPGGEESAVEGSAVTDDEGGKTVWTSATAPDEDAGFFRVKAVR